MAYQTTLHYNLALLRKAVLSFWWRVVGLRFLIVLTMLSAGLIYLLLQGDRSWQVGALATIIFLGISFLVLLYTNHYRNGLQKLKDMGAPQASFEASESLFSFKSGAGSASFPWTTVTEIWRFDGYWLMLFSKAQFVTLPTTDIPLDFQTFILERVRASGGAIV